MNALIQRQNSSKIDNEITVIPELRDIFTNEHSLLGSRGKTIKEMRTDHKSKKTSYKKRKTFEINLE